MTIPGFLGGSFLSGSSMGWGAMAKTWANMNTSKGSTTLKLAAKATADAMRKKRGFNSNNFLARLAQGRVTIPTLGA